MKLSHKIFAFSFLIGAATLAAVAVHTVEQTTKLLTNQAISTAAQHAEREASILHEHVKAAESDALILAAVDAARQMSGAFTEREHEGHRAELGRIFRTVMSEKRFYAQVRLIGIADEGRELVRVDQDATGIRTVKAEALQAKGERYYFRHAIALGQDQVFVSKLDLNREHGRIVTPHQPMLRISTPVFDSRDRVVGVIVINIDMNVLLKDIVALGPDGFPVLTDCGGEYLYHPDASRTFATEFGRSDKVQDEHGIQEQWSAWIRDPASSVSTSLATLTHILSVARIDLPGAWDEADGIRTLVIGNVLPQTMIRKAGDDLRDHLYITLLGVCAFLGVAIGGATAFLTRPVSTLTTAADRIAAGENDVEVRVTASDEIGTLAKALRRMLRSLEEASRTKELAALGRMSAMVAHDLRNALSSIKVNMATLEKGCLHPTEQRERQWGLAKDQMGYMEAVLTDMLTFSRPEQPQFDWLDMKGVLNAATIAVSEKAAEKGVAVKSPDLPPLPAVWGDRTQLIRLFRNLTENAVQASQSGGIIRFEGSVAMTDQGNEVIVKVIDNGEGIPAENRDNLFDPFFTSRTMGTGLGLAIVKRTVDQHGGRIDFHSVTGTGTTFVVALPTQPVQGD